MPESASSWREAFRVRSYEVDPGGAASIQTICNYLQEAAGSHARALGVSVEHLVHEQIVWMLSRFVVEIDVYPRWRDTVTVETWPSGVEGLFAHREFILTGADGDVIGRAASAWLLVDVLRRRPVRMPAYIVSLKLPHRERVLVDPFRRIPVPDQVAHEQSFRVRFADIDVNRHVNNVRYIEWAIEGLPPELLEGSRPRRVEVSYRSEAVFGDSVRSLATPTAGVEEPQYVHQLLRASDGRELATLRTAWRRSSEVLSPFPQVQDEETPPTA
jgi:medium-chain acyl-[acyl-carrier-protein] hydrolase